MPYPVSPPPPPAIVNVVSEEFSQEFANSAPAAAAAQLFQSSTSPEVGTDPIASTSSSASIELQVFDPEWSEVTGVQGAVVNELPGELSSELPIVAPAYTESLIPISRLPEFNHRSNDINDIAEGTPGSPVSQSVQSLSESSELEPESLPSPPAPEAEPPAQPATPPPPEAGTAQPGTAPTDSTIAQPDVLELNADRQEYDERNRVFQAEGNVELRFRGATLTSTRLLVNIPNRIAVAEGDAVLTRGLQVLRGDRIEYNLVQNQGNIFGARGELSLPSLPDDTADTPPPTTAPPRAPGIPPLGSVSPDQPLQVFGSTGGINLGVNTPGQSGGSTSGTGSQNIGRLRFEADQIEFDGAIWQATNVQITNDPFSPPELELRSSRVTVTPLGPGRTEIRARNPRLVFDQGFSLPLLQNRFIIDNRERNPGLLSFGFDEEDRGGFFVERAFDFSAANGVALLTLTPQVLVQRAITEGFGASSFGLLARLNIDPSPATSIQGNATFTTFDFEDFEDTFRGSFRARQQVFRHTAALEYSYRDRLFNGSLGFQDVQSSLGLVVTSPTYTLGDTGINLTYQVGAQYIDADANNERLDEADIFDRLDFNEDGSRDNNRIDLARYQASATLSRFFFLWLGTALPPTPDQGLRYTPNPVVPYVGFFTSLRGVFSAYSNGDTQSVLSPVVGLSGQFGHFSRPFLDYTAVGVGYSYNAVGGETPFNFDRVNDIQTLSLSLTQQIYGPFRFGIQASFFLESRDDREEDADTTFTLEYSRRTYAITLSYSPQRESGALGLRISDFNWVGDPGPFTGLGADNVSGGLRIPGN